jgi:preprotein translocase subunit SecA
VKGSYLVQQEFLRPISRREAYLTDVTYGTNHEFGFDYLRDNLAYSLDQQVQRGQPYAIIDEVDSILIDEARTPLIIAAPDTQSSEYYKVFARIATMLQKDEDYDLDEKRRSAAITEKGIEKVEKVIGINNLYSPENLRLVHYLEESLKAKALFERDKDYVVKNGEVIIVDEFTGRMLQGRRYNGGLHQAIEAKEGVRVQEESKTYAKISIQNYFRLYEKIAGMTGTAQTSAEEFHKVYKMEVVSIPTNRPLIRADANDVIYKTSAAKWRAVAKEVKARHEKGQPVLLGTTSIERNELLSQMLATENVPHEVLNAKNNEREGAIIAQAGRQKGVTVATNMAGRGVDIILGGNPPDAEEAKKVKELGGLHVIGTERHEARRIDNQLRGRAGRQGDQGSTQFFLSLEDDLLRIFGGDRIKRMMDRFDIPEDEPIQISFISKAVAEAQAKVEGAHFDMRKHLLEYDDVLNKQRSAIYKRREEILGSLNKDELVNTIFNSVDAHFSVILPIAEGNSIPTDVEKIAELQKLFGEAQIVNKDHPWPAEPTAANLRGLLTKRSMEAALEPQIIQRILSILDVLWMSQLEDLDALSESVGLRAYGQKDPLVEYRQEAHRLFQSFWSNFNAWMFMNLFRFVGEGKVVTSAAPAQSSKPPDHVGRNDPCPCGNGKKYKKCHGK